MSDLLPSATTEKTENRETAVPVTPETSIPVTGDTAINVTEENATPVQEETSIPKTGETDTPMTVETTIPMTEETNISMTEMDNDEPKDSQLVPNPEDPSFNELNLLLDDFGSVIQTFTGMTNATSGVLVFFLQLWALLISAMNVDIDPTGLLSGVYLVMLAAVMKLEKVRTIELACCLTLFAMILGLILIVLHSWSIYLCEKLYDYCSTLSPETLDISTVASCRWFDQRLIIDSIMVACGIVVVIFNGSFLYALSFFKTTI